MSVLSISWNGGKYELKGIIKQIEMWAIIFNSAKCYNYYQPECATVFTIPTLA